MTTRPEHRALALLEAKRDALSATEAFLDALGRLMLLNIEAAVADLTPPPPPPAPVKPTTLREQLLQQLHDLDERDLPLDQSDLNARQHAALKRLQRDHLATHLGGGLWRLTLAGLNAARQQAAA